MVSVPSGASERGLKRLLRRRSRKNRMSRSFVGKEYRSWGEYAPRTLQTTGDHEPWRQWIYVVFFGLAFLIIPSVLGWAIPNAHMIDHESLPNLALSFLGFIWPWVVTFALIVLSLAFTIRITLWRDARARKKAD